MRARTQVHARAQERESEREMSLAFNSHVSEAGPPVKNLLINTTAHEVQHAAAAHLLPMANPLKHVQMDKVSR